MILIVSWLPYDDFGLQANGSERKQGYGSPLRRVDELLPDYMIAKIRRVVVFLACSSPLQGKMSDSE